MGHDGAVSRGMSVAVLATVVLALAGCGSEPQHGPREPVRSVISTEPQGPSSTHPLEATIPRVDPSALDCPVTDGEAREALDAGAELLRRLPRPRVDGAWVLREVAARHGWPDAEDPLAGRTPSEPTDPSRRLLDPTAEPGGPGGDRTSAERRLVDDSAVVFGAPGPGTVAAVDAFTARPDETGYALTHQLLALIWARQIGLDLPAAVTDREPELARRVHGEIGGPGESQDLFAERAGLVAMYAPELVTPDERAAWLCRAVRTREPGSVWLADGPYRQRYDGETFDLAVDAQHVTATMTLLLGALLAPA